MRNPNRRAADDRAYVQVKHSDDAEDWLRNQEPRMGSNVNYVSFWCAEASISTMP